MPSPFTALSAGHVFKIRAANAFSEFYQVPSCRQVVLCDSCNERRHAATGTCEGAAAVASVQESSLAAGPLPCCRDVCLAPLRRPRSMKCFGFSVGQPQPQNCEAGSPRFRRRSADHMSSWRRHSCNLCFAWVDAKMLKRNVSTARLRLKRPQKHVRSLALQEVPMASTRALRGLVVLAAPRPQFCTLGKEPVGVVRVTTCQCIAFLGCLRLPGWSFLRLWPSAVAGLHVDLLCSFHSFDTNCQHRLEHH